MPGQPAAKKSRTPYADRRRLYEALGKSRKSQVLLYVTGDRPNSEAQINSDALDYFVEQLDAIGVVNRISLVLYTRGGDTLAAWSLVNLVRMFCDELEVITPFKAHSAGTLISLGANRIVMTKQATLGPIDPSITGPLNPLVPGAPADARAPVSVEAIRGYVEFVRKVGEIKNETSMGQILTNLATQVHPLVLGQVFRTRDQIRYLANELLAYQVTDAKKVNKIIDFLCSESGSHDYTINRREASKLGLVIEKPTSELYKMIKDIYISFRNEMELRTLFDPRQLVASAPSAQFKRVVALIESAKGGAYGFVVEGEVTKTSHSPAPGASPRDQVDLRVTSQGWRKIA